MVSVIIPCLNERDRIGETLDSVRRQETGYPIEIILADGMSDDGTRDIVQRIAASDKRIRIIDNPAKSIPAAMNAAIRASRGAIIIRMDAHTEYKRDYIEQCLRVLEQSGCQNVGGPARTRSNGFVQAAIAAAYHSFFSAGGARFHDVSYEGEVDTVTYGCWRRESFDKFGWFDENQIYNEDDEFNLRMRLQGGIIWQSPTIVSWYWPRESLSDLFRQYRNYGYWKVRILKKHGRTGSLRHWMPSLFLLALSVCGLIGFVCSPGFWGLLFMLASYLLAASVASLHTAARSRWSLFPALPLVFACYHLAYGMGFIQGVYDSLLARKSPRASYKRLTRTNNISSR
jgi:succinoglycan biosynthesis protein ExoA